MARKRYVPADNKFVDHTDVDVGKVSAAIYDEVGATFTLQWIDGEPVVDSANLPDGVTMTDVKKAIKNNHPRA